MKSQMRLRGIAVFFLALLALATMSSMAHATVSGLTVKIEGTAPANGPSNISGTYATEADSNKTYTITAASAGNPRVDANDDPDWLRLHNAVITADHDGVTGHICFWVALDPPPNGSTKVDLITNGTLLRKSGAIWVGAVNDWIDISGFLQHPAGSPTSCNEREYWEHIGSAPFPPPSQHWIVLATNQGTIPNLTTTENLTGITSQRLLKGEFWFYLQKKGDKLTFNQNSGVLVQASAGPGGPGETPPGVSGGTTCPQCCCGSSCPEPGKIPPIFFEPKHPWWKLVPLPLLQDVIKEREKIEPMVR